MLGLTEIRAEVAAFASSFDAAVVSPIDAERVVREASKAINMLETIRALAAKRAAESGRWRREGAASPAQDLARKTGTSVTKAKEALDTANKLEALPALNAAARAGEVSPAQAAPIAAAASADPSAERRLLDKARRASLGELRDECDRTKAAAEPDDKARHEAIHKSRHLRKRRCADGAAELSYRSTVDEVAELFAVVQGFANREFDLARIEDRHEPEEAYLADGLLAACRAAAGTDAPTPDANAHGKRVRKTTPTKVIVRVDWDALLRGWPIDGEVCEIAGLGPVPVNVVRAMLGSGDAFLAGVVTKGEDVVNVFHLGRKPVAVQATALQWQSPTCITEGCNNHRRLEKDHRNDWAETKVTLLRWLEHHCEHCHDLKTRLGWALVEGKGKRPLVPPDDPRHPHYQGQEPRAG
jgi:hypothetical protein